MNKQFVIIIFFIIVISIVGTELIQTTLNNYNHLKVFRSWISLKLENGMENDALQDGIPDGWNPQSWGGARAVFEIDKHDVLSGKQAINVKHTNSEGNTALTQVLPVIPDERLLVKVYAKGDGGAIQVRLHDQESREWITRGFGGWQDIVQSDKWVQHQISLKIPASANKMELRLRGSNLYDEAYVGYMDETGKLGGNLLINPGFEHDGTLENPLTWWSDQTQTQQFTFEIENTGTDHTSYLNIIDMLAGNYESIRERSAQLEHDCGSFPDMTGWLLAKGENINPAGGLADRERLYQLAIYLAPNCPQPYVFLANLYKAQGGIWSAAELYRQAAELYGETPMAGRYYFEEGLLHVRNTGDYERAVFALQKAEKLSGWDAGGWYAGVAPLHLGIALEGLGRHDEAVAAYQRILDCQKCNYHHLAAQNRLDVLMTPEK